MGAALIFSVTSRTHTEHNHTHFPFQNLLILQFLSKQIGRKSIIIVALFVYRLKSKFGLKRHGQYDFILALQAVGESSNLFGLVVPRPGFTWRTTGLLLFSQRMIGIHIHPHFLLDTLIQHGSLGKIKQMTYFKNLLQNSLLLLS